MKISYSKTIIFAETMSWRWNI